MKTLKKQGTMDITCGIDFGTSNTTVAIAKDNNDPIILVPVEVII